jgi:hypothetical protein
MSFWESVVVMTFLGEDIKFWITILVGLVLKWLFTPRPDTLREAMSGIAAGASLAYYGSDWVINYFPAITEADRNLVIIGLVITGEHIVRAMVSYGPRRVTKMIGIDEDDEEENARNREIAQKEDHNAKQ